MSSVAQDIRTLLVNRIQALSTVQKVYPYEHPHPEGWPSVFVTPSDMEGTFVTTAENRRIYGFNLTVLFPTGQNLPKDASQNKTEYAENVIFDVVDDILIDIDKNFTLDGATILFIEAADAEWGFFEYEGGSARACRVILRINTDFNVTS